jgi:hypothetical protein
VQALPLEPGVALRFVTNPTDLETALEYTNQGNLIEAAGLRLQFQNAMGLCASLPQLLVRFGYADPMPRSLRRPVEQVII